MNEPESCANPFRGQLQPLRLSFNYFASCDGNIRVVEFYGRCVYCRRRILNFPRRRRSLRMFYQRIIIQTLVTKNIILILSSNYQIVSHEIAVFVVGKKNDIFSKPYIFVIFIRSKYEPLALMIFSQRDSQPTYSIFIKLYAKKFFECCDSRVSNILFFLKPKWRNK